MDIIEIQLEIIHNFSVFICFDALETELESVLTFYTSVDTLVKMSSFVRRPCVSLELAGQLAKKFYNFERINEIKELDSYSDRNFYVQGQRSNSYNTSQENETDSYEQGEYVLKILNSADSEHGDFIEAENEVMTFLRERELPCPSLFPVAGSGGSMKLLVQIPLCNDGTSSVNEDVNKNVSTTDHEWCVIRLISFLPGVTAESFGKFSCGNLFNIGQFVGRLSKSFQEFQCPVLHRKSDRWSIENFLSLESYVTSVDGEENRSLVRKVLGRFASHVTPKILLLRRGAIHNDVNKGNLLIDTSSGEFKISGLIDFGDMHFSCLLFELATNIAAFINDDDVLAVSGYLIAGYQAVFPLPGLEFELLHEAVSARLCQVFLIASRQAKERTDNELLTKVLVDFLAKLKAWLSISRDEAMEFWRKIELDVNNN